MENELWSSTLYPHFDTRNHVWVIAFDDDGQRWASAYPVDDFWVPTPDSFTNEAGVEAAIAVLKVWEAPVAASDDGELLPFDELRRTPEWAALVPHFPSTKIGAYTEAEFSEAEDIGMTGGLPGAYDHYLAMVEAGVQVEAA